MAATRRRPTLHEYNQLLNPPSEAVVRARLTLEDGQLLAPEDPGPGVTRGEEAIEEYAVVRF